MIHKCLISYVFTENKNYPNLIIEKLDKEATIWVNWLGYFPNQCSIDIMKDLTNEKILDRQESSKIESLISDTFEWVNSERSNKVVKKCKPLVQTPKARPTKDLMKEQKMLVQELLKNSKWRFDSEFKPEGSK